MTEEERAALTEAKAEVTEWLSGEDIRRYSLGYLDKRLNAYVSEVAKNPSGHNLWEQLAVRRFLMNVEKYEIDAPKVHRFFSFYERLQFPGKRGDQCYPLTPVQAFQFASIYGFWKDGKRVVREACLYVPRKFSKTTGTASIAIYDLLFGDANAECYVGANSFDQAKKCFDVIRSCMRHLDPQGLRYQVNEQRIKSRRMDRPAFAQCLTATARTKDGLNASTIIMDEFSQARDNTLLTVLTTSMGVRENPLTVIITTASDVFEGPFYDMLKGYKQVLLGEFEDDSVFAHLFEPDVDDKEDDPSTWKKVHPHLGITVESDFYEQEYRKAKRSGSEAMLAFRTKLLNIYSENERRAWISSSQVRKAMRPIDPGKFRNRPEAMVAIDLSESDDFSAVSIGMYSPHDSSMHFHTAYFFPKDALSGHPNERLYMTWAEKGYLRLLNGDVIDYDAIVDYILWLNDQCTILGIGYDPWKSQQMVNQLRAHPMASGVDNVLREVRQSYGYFTAPCESFEHGIKTGALWIDDNPINAYCFGNAVLDYDNMENFKPVKRRQTQKIDGVITMLMAMRLWLDAERGQS